MPEARTRTTALEALLGLLPQTAAEITDPAVRALLTPELVSEVFTQSWKHQFEDDRAHFQRRMKEIVLEATEQLAHRGTAQ